MKELRTWHEILIADLAANRAEAIDYFDVSLQEYQADGDLMFFLKGLRNIIEVLGGVSEIAKQTNIEPEALREILSSDDAPGIDTLNAIINALGCRLSVEPIEAVNPSLEVKHEDHRITAKERAPANLEVATD